MEMNEREQIDAALRRPGYADRLAPSLDREFSAQTSAARRKCAFELLCLALLVSLVCLPIDAADGIGQMSLVLKLGIETPITVGGLWLLRREGSPCLSALAFAVPVVVTNGVLVALGILSPPGSSMILLTGAGLLCFFVNISPGLRLRHTVKLCVVNLAVYLGLPASHLLGTLSTEGICFVLLFSMVMTIALRAKARQERYEQDAFLLRRRDALQNEELERLVTELTRVADRDSLTDIGNRRCFDRTFGLFWKDALVEGGRLALAMIDIDHFKRFNDTAGHAAGDGCLRAVARAIAGQVRPGLDLPTRYGGEEFAVLMPLPASLDRAAPEPLALADRMRIAVEELGLVHPGLGPDGRVTVSIGVSVVAPGSDGHTPETLLEAADRALYEAKHAGRNRVRLAVSKDLEPVNRLSFRSPRVSAIA